MHSSLLVHGMLSLESCMYLLLRKRTGPKPLPPTVGHIVLQWEFSVNVNFTTLLDNIKRNVPRKYTLPI